MNAVAQRGLSMLLTLWLAATLAFFALRVLPGDAIEGQLARSGVSAAIIQQRRAAFGLTDPLWIQYGRFLLNLLHGDLGISLVDRQPVTPLILEQFVPTATLAVSAWCVAIVLGLGLGVASALELPLWAATARILTSLAISTPIYWTGTLAIIGLTLAADRTAMVNTDDTLLVLPIMVLGFHTSGAIARVIQGNVQEVLNADFVRTARAKGLSETTILWKHGLRVALIPAVSIIALQAGFLLGGAVITESLFVRPGVGRLLLDRTLLQDYPVVQGIVILAAVVYTVLNTAADLSQRILDPRI